MLVGTVDDIVTVDVVVRFPARGDRLPPASRIAGGRVTTGPASPGSMAIRHANQHLLEARPQNAGR
jgi:hypothetical protein